MTKVTQLFTFGFGQAFANCFVSITAPTAEECRQVMFATFGKRWSMQYDENKFDDFVARGMKPIADIDAADGQMTTQLLPQPLIKGEYAE